MSDKIKYPRAAALAVAKELCDLLKPLTLRLIVAGSLRRRKSEVGDVEIVYIPRIDSEADGFFDKKEVILADAAFEKLIAAGTLAKRTNVNGSEMWGPKNKLAVHVASGIPVDLFAARLGNWFNYVVCRTGGAQSNVQIASAAQARGWKWNPYGVGFTDENGADVFVNSERDAFELVGLKYLEPWERA